LCRVPFLPRRQHGALQFLVHVDVALCRGFIFQHMLARVGGVCCFAEYPLPLFKAVKGRFNLRFSEIISVE